MTGQVIFDSAQMVNPSVSFSIASQGADVPSFGPPWIITAVEWTAVFTANPGDRVFSFAGINGSIAPINLTNPTGSFPVSPTFRFDLSSIVTLSTVNLSGQSILFTFDVTDGHPPPPIIYPGFPRKINLPPPSFKCKC